MKVRISVTGAYCSMDFEEDRAMKVFRNLSRELLGMEEPVAVEMEVSPVIDVSEVAQKISEGVSGEVTIAEPDASEESPAPFSKMQPKAGHKGFLYIQCPYCQTERGFCVKETITKNICRGCGSEILLENMAPLYVDCECGSHYRYMTNMGEKIFDISCINCGSSVAVNWNARKKLYETIR